MTMHPHLPLIIDSFTGGGARLLRRLQALLDRYEAQHARFCILSCGAEVRGSMAVRTKGNHVPGIIGATVRQPANVMGLEVGRAVRTVERCRCSAVFAAPVRPSINIGAYQPAPLERGDHGLPLAGRHFRSRDSSRAQIGKGDTARYGRPLISVEKCRKWTEFKDNCLPHLPSGVGCITKVETLADELVFVLNAGPNLSENQDVPPLLSVISDSTIAADHLHVAGLALARVLKHPVRADRILIAVRLTFLPSNQKDRARGVRRCDNAALLLSTEARMDVRPPVVDPALLESPRHTFAPRFAALPGKANAVSVNNPLTDVTGPPLAEALIAANCGHLRMEALEAQA